MSRMKNFINKIADITKLDINKIDQSLFDKYSVFYSRAAKRLNVDILDVPEKEIKKEIKLSENES